MRITFDTNAWERIFAVDASEQDAIRVALQGRRIQGFICDAGFRIEAIRKNDRSAYFQQPYMDIQFSQATHDGRSAFKMSIGPDDGRHPGLPREQKLKLERAFAAGVKLLRGGAWMGLPTPPEILSPSNYPREEPDAAFDRQQREIQMSSLIEQRGVGKAAFDAADGWEPRIRDASAERRLSKACAEWADGETVAAHFAYRNDILCTDDNAGGAGRSIFDSANRGWLTADHQIRFMTVDELADALSS